MEIAGMSIDSGPDVSPPAPSEEQVVPHPDQIYFDWIIAALAEGKPRLNRKGLAAALGIDPAAVTSDAKQT
jgi:hypothetical protein